MFFFGNTPVHYAKHCSLHMSNHYSCYWIAQLHIVFQIPKGIVKELFPDTSTPAHLTYTEWFSPLSATQDINHQMYRVLRLMHGGWWCATVIPVESILGSASTSPIWSSHSPWLEWCFSIGTMQCLLHKPIQ